MSEEKPETPPTNENPEDESPKEESLPKLLEVAEPEKPKESKPKTTKKTTSKKTAKKATKKAAKKEVPKVVEKEEPKLVTLRSKFNQLLVLEIKDAKGALTTVRIPARGSIQWPKLEDYGADVRVKCRKKLLYIFD